MAVSSGSTDQQSPLRTRWAAFLGPKRWIQAIAALALAVTALFGGLDRVDAGVTTVKPGEQYDDGALTVTVQRAKLVPVLTAGDRVMRKADPGTQFLAVVATLVNDGTQPVPLRRELELRDVEQARIIAVFRLADGTTTAYLGPGLSDEFAFVWQVPETALSAGDDVLLRIWQKRYQEMMVASGRGWIDGTDYGKVMLTVETQK
jgi:hypothetical protein